MNRMSEVYTKIWNPDILRKNILELTVKLTELGHEFKEVDNPTKKKEIINLKKIVDRSKRDFELLEETLPLIEGESVSKVDSKKGVSGVDREVRKLHRKLKEI